MSYEMRVEAAKICEFARATWPSQSADVAWPDTIVTPRSSPQRATFWTDWENGFRPDFDPMRVLHAEDEFVFRGPPKAAQTR